MNKIEENSATTTIPKDTTDNTARWCIECLVCGEGVPVHSPYGREYKICDKCKKAILRMRECMEGGLI
jgi:hypothetical protein